MATLVLEHICKCFDGNVILEDINLETKDDEFVVLLGPSGCGKTTLLRIIAGLERPSSGRVYLDGKDITDLDPRERNVSMIFQNYPVYPHLSPYDNIALPLKLRGASKSSIAEEVERIAKKLGIASHLRRRTATLSGGELQRVAIGKALVKKPAMFLMDEPLSDLDVQVKLSAREMIKAVHQDEKRLFIYVTHDHSEANSLADRIALISDHRVVQFDDPRTLYNEPMTLFVAQFIGSPPINVFDGEISRGPDGLVLVTSIGTINLASERLSAGAQSCRDVTAGLRPESADIVFPAAGMTDGALGATVKYSEFMGNQSMIWIHEIAGFRILYRGNRQFTSGEAIHFSIQAESLLFFNRSSGERL